MRHGTSRLSAAVMIAAAIAASPVFGEPPSLESQIAPSGSTVAGKTIGEWSGKWWTWLLATPLHRDPALDETGEHCGIDQDGPVWFLAGSFSDQPVTRRCKVPEGKYILFPMFTGIVKPTPEQTQATCDTSRDKAARFAEAVLGVYASLDGAALAAPEQFRERTTACFDPSGTGRAISAQDGYWVMLRPLPPGKHVLRYGRDEKGGRNNIDVSYVLQVGGDASPAAVETARDEAAPYPRRIEHGPPRRSPVPDRNDAAGGPTDDDFPRYVPAVIRLRPGFGLRDIEQRLVALILREGKYKVVSQNRRIMGAVADIRFTWPDVQARYAASDALKHAMPHPMVISITPIGNGTYSISGTNVNPNPGPSFALRAEIVNDAARLVTLALDRRVRVTDEERLRAIRYRAPDFAKVAGGDPVAEIRASFNRKREEARDRAAASRPPSEADKRQFTAGDLSAAGSELHAVAVYEGPRRSGPATLPRRVTVTVVPFTTRPVVLLLSAYEPVEWYVVSVGAKVSKIIALGHGRQTVASAPGNSERVSRSVEDGFKGAYLGYGENIEDVAKFFARAEALTGERPATFQGKYSAADFIVDGDGQVWIAGKRASLPAQPERASVIPNPGAVRFEAPKYVAHVAPDGLSFTSCLSGVAEAVRTNRSHVRGKVYFELTLKARPGTLHPSVDLGLAPAAVRGNIFLYSAEDASPQQGIGVLGWGGASSYKDGDVFGIAADLDEGKLYFHVNGDWKGKPPGSAGIPITAGRAYAAAASISTESTKEYTDCNGWSGNFGGAPFKYPLPEGYMPYDGAVTSDATNGK